MSVVEGHRMMVETRRGRGRGWGLDHWRARCRGCGWSSRWQPSKEDAVQEAAAHKAEKRDPDASAKP